MVGVAVDRLGSPAGSLSGGNQQKVLLGRALQLEGTALLALDEPTRGVDVGGRAEIHKLVREAARKGTAVIFSSTELDEVLDLADVVVTHLRRPHRLGRPAGGGVGLGDPRGHDHEPEQRRAAWRRERPTAVRPLRPRAPPRSASPTSRSAIWIAVLAAVTVYGAATTTGLPDRGATSRRSSPQRRSSGSSPSG